MGELIKSSLYGFLGSALFFIVRKGYLKYKGMSYDREKTVMKEYIVFLLYPEIKKRTTSFYIGKTIKWFFINIIIIIFDGFIVLLILSYLKHSADLTALDLFNINYLFTLPVFSAQILIALSSFITGITVAILSEYINKLNKLLYLNYEVLEKELKKFKKKFNNKLDDEINGLINTINDKVEKNRDSSFVDENSLKRWLSKAIEDYEKNY